MIRAILLVVLIAPFSSGFSWGADKDEPKAKADPAGTPLELTISAKETTFVLRNGGLSAADYTKKLEAAAKEGQPLLPPAVNLLYEVKNTSNKAVQVWTSGDPVVFSVTVKGKGALNLNSGIAFTEEFRSPKATEIAAGKAYSQGIITLMSGFRGRAVYSYWTEPGEYELVATLKTAVKPAPEGAKVGEDGFGIVTLTSAPLKVKVEAKK